MLVRGAISQRSAISCKDCVSLQYVIDKDPTIY